MHHYIKPHKKTIQEIENEIDKSIIGLCIWPRVKDKDLHSDNFTGLCNSTAIDCIYALKQIQVFAYPYYIGITAKSPIGDRTIDHYVCIVQIDNITYIYDMPQCEFIRKAETIPGGFKYINNYEPRFIELTIDNLEKYYITTREIAEKNYKNIIKYKTNDYSFQEYLEQTKNKYNEETSDFVFDNW